MWCKMATDMAELTLNVENLVTFAQAAEELGVSRPTVYNLVEKYRLHPVAIGKNKFILREELEALKRKYAGEKSGESQAKS